MCHDFQQMHTAMHWLSNTKKTTENPKWSKLIHTYTFHDRNPKLSIAPYKTNYNIFYSKTIHLNYVKDDNSQLTNN